MYLSEITKMNCLKRYKVWFNVMVAAIVCFVIYYYNANLFKKRSGISIITQDVSCYNKSDIILTLNADQIELKGSNIYFLETSCKGGLNSRQACAVESAALANPSYTVYIFVTGPLDPNYHDGKALSLLSSLPNVEFARINVTDFSNNTKLQYLYSRNRFHSSLYPVVHHSDVLRLLILNKYGGVYLDLDVIVMKPFDSLPTNFVTKENDFDFSSGILGFSKDGIGYTFTDRALEDLSSSFDPQAWSGNGPGLIKRIMNDMCNNSTDSTTWSLENTDGCKGIKMFDKEFFYPIPYPDWDKYYKSDWEQDLGEFPTAYTHHTWNALGGTSDIKPNSLFEKLAKRYCPMIYEIYGKDFGM